MVLTHTHSHAYIENDVNQSCKMRKVCFLQLWWQRRQWWCSWCCECGNGGGEDDAHIYSLSHTTISHTIMKIRKSD